LTRTFGQAWNGVPCRCCVYIDTLRSFGEYLLGFLYLFTPTTGT